MKIDFDREQQVLNDTSSMNMLVPTYISISGPSAPSPE